MTAADWGLLQPVTAGTPDAPGDDDVLAAMVRVEAALLRAWVAEDGGGDDDAARVLEQPATPQRLDRDALVAGVARDGAPVVALVEQLRALLDEHGAAAGRLHAGATSQDVLDTALMVVARESFARLRVSLVATGRALATLADAERAAPRLAHTLGRAAAPTTLGAQAAVWLDGVSSAVAAVDAVHLPVQLGGAVGTGEQADREAGRAGTAASLRASVAAGLGLEDPGRSWHTDRTPVLGVATAAATASLALGRIGRDLLAGARDGVDEIGLAGSGTSSAMPHKRNAVGPVAMCAAAVQAPGLLSTVARAAVAVDERPAGEWHAEWRALLDLLRLGCGSAGTADRTARTLAVHREAALRNLRAAGLPEPDAVTLVACGRAVDDALARFERVVRRSDGGPR
jgi:3-carboxy-cis,cis-muconate cycloisomerase